MHYGKGHNFVTALLTWDGTPKEKLLLIVLNFHTNEKTKQCFPSNATLEKETGMSRMTIFRVRKSLEDKKILKCEIKSGKSISYSIDESKLGVAPQIESRQFKQDRSFKTFLENGR